MGFKRQADPQDVEEIPDDEPEARVPWRTVSCFDRTGAGDLENQWFGVAML